MSVTLMIVLASQVYTDAQTHQIVYIKCVKFLYIKYASAQLFFKNVSFLPISTGYFKTLSSGSDRSI